MSEKGTSIAVMIVLICFWVLMAIFSRAFEVQLSKTDLTDITNAEETLRQNDFWSYLDGIPFIEKFVPLFKIMTFQYADNLPVFLTLILDGIALITAIAFLDVIRK